LMGCPGWHHPASSCWTHEKSDERGMRNHTEANVCGGNCTDLTDPGPTAGRTKLTGVKLAIQSELPERLLQAGVPSRPQLQANRSRCWHALSLAILASFFSPSSLPDSTLLTPFSHFSFLSPFNLASFRQVTISTADSYLRTLTYTFCGAGSADHQPQSVR
jgi:hypothetical protein